MRCDIWTTMTRGCEHSHMDVSLGGDVKSVSLLWDTNSIFTPFVAISWCCFPDGLSDVQWVSESGVSVWLTDVFNRWDTGLLMAALAVIGPVLFYSERQHITLLPFAVESFYTGWITGTAGKRLKHGFYQTLFRQVASFKLLYHRLNKLGFFFLFHLRMTFVVKPTSKWINIMRHNRPGW